MIYPPPNAEDIKAVKFCTFNKRIVILTANDNILFYKLEKKVAVLEQTIFPEMLKDSEGKTITGKICSMEIASNEVEQFDFKH